MFVDKKKDILIIVASISIMAAVIYELLMMIKTSDTKLSKFVSNQFHTVFVSFLIIFALLIIAMLFMIVYNKIIKMRNKNR